VHNIESIKSVYPYTVYAEMHSRDTTVLIDLLWFLKSCTTPACFSTFSIYYGPYSSWKFLIF